MQNSILKLLRSELTKQQNVTAKQQAVLQAAITLFAEKGFAATSTSEIAKRAGVAEGTVFKHYQTKEKLLFSAVLPVLVDDVFPLAFAQFKHDVLERRYPDFAAFIDHFVEDRFAFVQENREILKILFTESLYRPEWLQMLKTTMQQHALQTLRPTLATFKEKKQLVDWPEARIMRTIFANLFGYVLLRFFHFPDLDWDDATELASVKRAIVGALRVD